MAAVQTNQVISDYFFLHRGTRQGCGLSPFLFDIAIEPLAIAIRSENKIRGITRGATYHKTSLYAGDLLLYLSAPLESVDLIDLLERFGKISGYKINLRPFCFQLMIWLDS